VIVDAPATGHGIGFLETPRTFARIARVGPMHAQAEALDAFICNHRRTGAALVAIPEEMPVNESALLEQRLSEDVGVAVDRVYMNALYPERFDDSEAQRLERAAENGLGPAAEGAIRAALSQHRRARSQRRQLARLREMVTTTVSTLPFVFEPELGMDEIAELAERIA
jgi:anion-transporting  ArsA/GET3 family ATPase